MPKTFDLTLLPLYRVRGNEMPSPPGLLALTPPRRKARSRAQDLLIIHLALSGNADFSTANYHQMTSASLQREDPGHSTDACVTCAKAGSDMTATKTAPTNTWTAVSHGRWKAPSADVKLESET